MNPFLTPFPSPAPEIEIEVDTADLSAPEPSARDLVHRALSEPPRAMWPSLHVTPDPVLQAKARPRVAERRERLTRAVKAGLAGCGLLCAAAVVAALLGGPTTASAAGAPRHARAAVVSKEGVEHVAITKKGPRSAEAVTPSHGRKSAAKAKARAKGRRGR